MTTPPDLRHLLEDLLRVGLQTSPGMANRMVDQLQVEYITNPYGRQPPHVLVFPDGRVERMTPFQVPVPGYAANVVAIELLGYPGQPPTAVQLQALASFGAQARQILAGRVGFTGNPDLVAACMSATASASPGFMQSAGLAVAPQAVPLKTVEPGKVHDLFDILGTPPERRTPLPPGSIFNSVNNLKSGGVSMRQLFKSPGARDVRSLVIVPSHDAHKPEPADDSAYSLEALRQADQGLGMSDFRGHYLVAKDGSLIEGRDLGVVGNCWPGKNDGAIQIVVAGNGKNPTRAQRETLYLYAASMRKAYERPQMAYVRDVAFADGLLGIDPNGVMKDDLANARLIEADSPPVKGQRATG